MRVLADQFIEVTIARVKLHLIYSVDDRFDIIKGYCLLFAAL